MKKGFTLVELLAVIVILAVISIITIPLIGNVIKDSKRKALEISVNGILDAIELERITISLPVNYKITNGNVINEATGEILPTKGGISLNGNIKITKDGRIIYAINNEQECIIKRDGQEKVEYIPINYCNMEVATNLVVNGYGEYGDNTNFSKFEYKDGSFAIKSDNYKYVYNDEKIKIETTKKYYISADMKNNVTNDNYVGVRESDYDKKEITTLNVKYFENTLTYLTQDLKNNDEVIYLNDVSNFIINETSPIWQRGIIFWNYQDSSGYQYPVETYSRNIYLDLYDSTSIDYSTNTIKLKTPWNHGNIEKGTLLSRSAAYFGYNYCLLNNEKLSNNYKNYNTIIGGYQNIEEITKMKYATNYIQFAAVINNNNINNSIINFKNIVIREEED